MSTTEELKTFLILKYNIRSITENNGKWRCITSHTIPTQFFIDHVWIPGQFIRLSLVGFNDEKVFYELLDIWDKNNNDTRR